MDNHYGRDLATALRDRIEAAGESVEQERDPTLTLSRSIERMLFQRGELAPVDAILERAGKSLDATEDWQSMTDKVLLELWNSTIQKLSLDFCRSPESWSDGFSVEFFQRSAVVFGVEENVVHELMRNFHKRPKHERFAIFLPIRRSSLFSYIEREIKEMEVDVEVADPTESMRSLIRSVDPTE